MKPLDARNQQHIIDLLTPLMATEQDRRAFLLLTLVDHALLAQIDFTGSTLTFLPAMIDKLYQFGKLDDGRPALWALLEVAREQVGLDEKHQIDALRPIFDLPPPARLDRVFLSYSRKNERDARRIVSDLKDAGLRVWYDREKIKGGEDWWQSIVRGIINADYFIFCLSPDSIRSQVARDELLVARQNNKPIFAVMLQDCLAELNESGFADIHWLPKLHIINFTQPERYGDVLRELIQSLPGYTPPDSYFIDQYDPHDLPNPFRGLEAFLEVDAAYFVGREDAVQDLLARLHDTSKPRLLAVVGASGSGKSSLVRAGLIPALRQALPFWETLTLKPGSAPLDELADRLRERLGVEADQTRERLRRSISVLDDIAADLMTGKPDDARFVLVIDQFEELFTLTDEHERQTFLDRVLYAVNKPQGHVQIILTLRADFFDRLSAVPQLAKLVRENLDIATEMTPDQLRRSIEEPARKVGVSYETGLVEQILEDVRAQPGSLPLLQYALKELFERKLGRRMTREAYEALGGMKGALATRAEAIYTALNPHEQEALRRNLMRLVEVGEDTVTRRRVAQPDLRLSGISDDVVQTVLDRLTHADARLLVASAPVNDDDPTNDNQIFYEVSHEALLTHWKRLADWIAENRDDLRRSSDILALAKIWGETGRSENSYLLSGGRLIAARDWLTRGDATPLQQAFVEASSIYEAEEIARLERLTREANDATQRADQATQASQTASQQAKWNRTIALMVGVAAAVIAIGATLISTTSVNNANAASTQVAGAQAELTSIPPTLDAIATEVQSAQNFADSLQLAARAQDTYNTGDPFLGLSLALEASRIDASARTEQILSDLAYQSGPRRRFTGHYDSVNSVAFSPAGQFAISGSDDATMILWNIETGDIVRRFEGLPGNVTSVAYSPDGKTVVSGGYFGELILWDVATGNLVRYFEGHTSQINSIAYSPDSKFILSGSSDNTLVLWDVASGEIILTFEGHSNAIKSVAFSPDGQSIVSGDFDHIMILWETKMGHLIRRFEEQVAPINSLAFSPDSETILSASSDDTLTLWNMETGESVRTFEGHTNAVMSAAFSPDGKLIISSSVDDTLILWDTTTGSQVRTFQGHTNSVYSVAFRPDGRSVLSGSADTTLILWDVTTGSLLRQFEGYGDDLTSVALSGDGQMIVAGSANSTLSLWDVTTGKPLNRFEVPSGYINFVDFSPDGRSIVSGANDMSVRLWDSATGEALRVFEGHSNVVNSVVFSTDGASVLSASDDGTLILWDVATGEMIRTFEASFGVATSVEFSPDGQQALAGYSDGTLALWNLTEGHVQHIFEGQEGYILSVAFSPDGQSVLSAANDKTLLVWDVTTGRILHRFEGYVGSVLSVAFSPDGQSILARSGDNVLILWDVETGDIRRRFEGPIDSNLIGRALFSPDGQSILSASDDGTLILWRNDSLEQLQAWTLQNRYVPDLTCEQRATYGLPSACIEGTPPSTPTLAPTRTPFVMQPSPAMTATS